MKKIHYIFILSLIFIIGSSFMTNINSTKNDNTFDLIELSHGIYITRADSAQKSYESPTGIRSYVSDVVLSYETDTIYGELGIHFGMEYMFKTLIDTTLKIKKVWIFPNKMINNSGKEFYQIQRDQIIKTNYIYYTGYSFEDYYEIIPGKWILRLYSNDKLLYEKVFVVIRSSKLKIS